MELLSLSVICVSFASCVLGGIALWLRNQHIVEREKNERILLVEQEKTSREERRSESHRLALERDVIGAKIDAGIFADASGHNEDDGFGGLIGQLLPILAQNPDILKNLFNKTQNQTQPNGGTGQNATTFPAVGSGNNTQ